MRRLSLQYIAGFLDGEGSIYISRSKCPRTKRGVRYALYIVFSSTNKNILEMIRNSLGGVGCLFSWDSKKNPRWKTAYYLHITCRQAAEVLRKLLPYLILKRPQAELAIKFQDFMDSSPPTGNYNSRTPEEWNTMKEYYEQMKELNRGGR